MLKAIKKKLFAALYWFVLVIKLRNFKCFIGRNGEVFKVAVHFFCVLALTFLSTDFEVNIYLL